MRIPENVENFPDLASAQLAQSLLEAAEIMSFIPDEALAGIDWRMSTALQGIRLQVTPSDKDAAKEILAAVEVQYLEAVPQPDSSDVDEICPRCHGVVAEATWKRRWKAATLLLPMIIVLWPILAFAKPPLVCRSCGAGYKNA